ncbi:MAG: hypothetical protein GY757_27770 [bacterium]|nr:hypothetical protein [bacterium]
MKNVIFCLILCVLIVGLPATVEAGLDQFTGIWKNNNPDGGLTKLLVKANGTRVTVQAWGKCHPVDCDWGKVNAFAYAPSVSSNLINEANAITAVFRAGHSKTFLVIHPRGNKQLKVKVYTHFTDNSNRTDYSTTHVLRRGFIAANVIQPIKPVAMSIYSKGTIKIRGTYNCDLDKGRETQTGADFWWEQVNKKVRYLVPRNGAEFHVLRRRDFHSITLRHLERLTYSPQRINAGKTGRNRLKTGTVVAARTSDGRYCKFKIAKYGYNLKITWVTYNKASPRKKVSPRKYTP